MKNILVTGGLGYIGSHTVIQLLKKGYKVTIIDNLSNSDKSVLTSLKKITNKEIKFYQEDLINYEKNLEILKTEKIDSVIHFAAFKAVGESVSNPIKYYENNVTATLQLLKAMKKLKIYNFIFSSSATVYSPKATLPLTETSLLGPINPYGNTKLVVEHILNDLSTSDSKWKIIALRYFNPLGADKSGLVGENPNGIPNNLVPYISKVALGELEELKIFGDDYDTKDGTGIRDYVHVLDLADGHVLALENLYKLNSNFSVFNLGSENGYSVYEIIKAFESVSEIKIPYSIIERRPGDLAISYSSSSKAKNQLNWEPKRNLEEMCIDTWKWNQNMR